MVKKGIVFLFGSLTACDASGYKSFNLLLHRELGCVGSIKMSEFSFT
jgi:hypothetical protein